MKVALGIHVGHDRGACIIKDGKVCAALAQERVDRIKHSSSTLLPIETIEILLEYCNLKITDISCIGLSYVAIEGNEVLDFYRREFFEYFNCNHIPFYFVSHHAAHAYSTYFSSGFNESLIFVADGGGDIINGKQEAETLYIAKDGIVQPIGRRLQNLVIRHLKDPINHFFPLMPASIQNNEISLARKYSQITHLLGFKNGQEGKTMGLASYGVPIVDYSNTNYQNLNFFLTYKDVLQEIFIEQLTSGKSYRTYLHDEKENIASTIQSYIEYAITSIIKNYTRKYSTKNLCLSGGIFLNCLTNHKIIEQCDLKEVFILPAAGDDGQALGCAYYAYIQQYGYTNKFQIDLPYLGIDYRDETILQTIKDKNLNYKRYSYNELKKVIAQFVSNNKIVALHYGRTEIGPRALCHRSIIANPTNPEMKDILNSRVKHREPFRPFAPTVIAEEQFKYFDLNCSSDYMLLATNVKKEYRKKLAAITHVDNTARIQAVSKEKEPFIHSILVEMKKLTGFPMVLNTSFNVAGQPIVETPLDAINTFLSTDIDILVIGNFVITKTTTK